MKFDELREIMRRAGIVGAGGAGFPAYAKFCVMSTEGKIEHESCKLRSKNLGS